MNRNENQEIIEDISFLYEMSLSIGQSLDLRETVEGFVNILMARKDYDYVSVWLNLDRAQDLENLSSECSLYYANPMSFTDTKKLPKDHDIIKLLRDETAIQVRSEESLFESLRLEKNIIKGTFVIYGLYDFGFIKLYNSKVEGVAVSEVNKLKNLVQKFANAILACTYYQLVKEQAEERKKLIDEQKLTLLQLNILIDSMKAGILLEDGTRHIDHINQEFCEIFTIPVPADQLIGVDCSAAAEQSKHLLADPEGFVKAIDVIIEEGKPVFGDEVIFADKRVFERDYVPIYYNGQPGGHLWQYRNITLRKQQEAEVRRSEQQFHSMFTNHNAIMLLVDPVNNIIVDGNSAAEVFYGIKFSDKTYTLDYIQIATKENKTENGGVLKQGESSYFMMNQVIAGNKRKDVEIHASPIFIENKELQFLIIHDVTEREKTKKELALRETYLSAIIENHPGMFWLKNIKGEYLYVNKLNSQHFNVSEGGKEYIGKTDFNFYDKERAEKYEMEDRALIRSKKSITAEEESIVNDKTIWYEKLKFPVQLNNEIIGIGGYAIDITNRVKNNATMRLQSAAFESISHAIVITDVQGVIQWVNPALTPLCGYKAEEIIGKGMGIFNSGQHPKDFYSSLWNTIKKGQVWSQRIVNKRKDGTLYHEEETITPVLDDHGAIAQFIAIKQDISEKISMEVALTESEQRWQFALEGSGDGVWDWNAVTNRVFYSASWKAMLGYYPDEISNTLEEWEKRIHPDDKQRCFGDLNKHLAGETDIYINEHRIRRKDGVYIWILDRGKVIKRDKGGHPIRVIGTHSDITSLKTVEEKLRQGIEKEKELNEMKSRFVSIASHEFRTPLATILATSEALFSYREKMSTEQIEKRLSKIKHQVGHLTRVVDDVLHLSRLRGGSVTFQPQEDDIILLCQTIVDELNIHGANKRITFTSFATSFIMNYDPTLIRQVLTNLLSNALKFSMPDKQVFITVLNEDNQIVIRIKDQGIGMDKADLHNLFEPFHRGVNAMGVSGTGLGLSIVKAAVEKHGGYIKYLTKLNQGTTFSVSLPVIT
ncbi:sensor histidine kinase [Mariniphaga sediminis]|uniref:sensor histidine kinase n=1 Tax=Mariniphaga sediminis TaxID=1628158 RepID=UPI003567E1D5